MNEMERKKELKALYKKWPDIKSFLRSKGCLPIDAEDIFQEALVIYCRKCDEKDFQLDVEAFHYVKSVCKFLWYNQARKQKPTVEHEDEIFDVSDDQDWLLKERKLRIIENAIETLGEKCRELLTSFYGLGLSMLEIAKKLGLRNEKVAKTQKYRCLQKAKEKALSVQQSTIENL